jgi:hypothetical protein
MAHKLGASFSPSTWLLLLSGEGVKRGGERDSLICWQLPLVTPAMEMRPVLHSKI